MWFQKQMKRECVCNLHTDLGKMTMWVWPLTFKNMFAIFKCKKCEIMNTNQVFWKKHFNLCSGFHWIKVRVLKRTKNNRKIVDIFFNENIRFDIHCGSHFIRKKTRITWWSWSIIPYFCDIYPRVKQVTSISN